MCNRRLFLVVATMVLTALFSGVIYGWTAMQVMLVRMGIYQQMSAGVQQEKFVLIETVGGVCTASSGTGDNADVALAIEGFSSTTARDCWWSVGVTRGLIVNGCVGVWLWWQQAS